MKIECNSENPYGGLIKNYFNLNFPSLIQTNEFELVEMLSTIILGTKEVRYGPLPNPEHLVVIRNIIRKSIENQKPIPFLIPWGGVKPNFSFDLDIAEVCGLNQIKQLIEKIKIIYKPGVDIVIRVEDESAYTLFELEKSKEDIHFSVDSYSFNFCKLVRILFPEGDVRTSCETKMENASIFESKLRENLNLMEAYLWMTKDTIQFLDLKSIENFDTYKELKKIGWKGIISYEQRQHYLETYKKLYSDWDEKRLIKRLALYFAGSLTKSQLKMNGIQSYWDKFIQLSFVSPIKGLPLGYDYHYIYYRTLPLSCARTHIPAWRAKGYFKIEENNEITPKLTTFNDKEIINNLNEATILFKGEKEEICIKTDYLII